MQVGAHEVSLEAPDLVVIRVRGPATASEVTKITEIVKETGRTGTGYILTILETAEFQGSPEARRHFAEAMRGLTLVVNAVVGANFRFRVILRFVENVARVISKIEFRVRFFDDETSARDWLRDQGCRAGDTDASPARDVARSTASTNGLSG